MLEVWRNGGGDTGTLLGLVPRSVQCCRAVALGVGELGAANEAQHGGCKHAADGDLKDGELLMKGAAAGLGVGVG